MNIDEDPDFLIPKRMLNFYSKSLKRFLILRPVYISDVGCLLINV